MKLIVFKKIKGWNGKYIISTEGDVLNTFTGNFIKPFNSIANAPTIRLYLNNKTQVIAVKKLVWKTFKKRQIPAKFLVLNKDFNRDNNYTKNLEVVKWGDYLRLQYEHRNKIRGVYKYKQTVISTNGTKLTYNRWRALLKVNNKIKTIGYYNSKKEAVKGFYEGYLRIYKRPPFPQELLK